MDHVVTDPRVVGAALPPADSRGSEGSVYRLGAALVQAVDWASEPDSNARRSGALWSGPDPSVSAYIARSFKASLNQSILS